MPWHTQGGPWGGGSNNGGGGGPWGGGGNGGGGGPWGSGGGRGPGGGGRRPSGGGGGGRGPQPPDFDEMIRKSQERLKRLSPKGGDKLLIGALIIGALGIWLFTGLYRVEADEQGVVTRFGEFVRLEAPGLHYHLPYPIESVQTPKVTRVNTNEIPASAGSRGRGANTGNASMLTGDSKIVELEFAVQWRILNAGDYLFQVRNPERTVVAAAESVMRELVGQNSIDYVLKDGREQLARNSETQLQSLLDEYKAGVSVTAVQLLRADPPAEVIENYRDVQRAAADKDRFKKEAEAYQRRVVPEARGEAAKVLEEAEAYRQQVIADASGNANRFNNVYRSYEQAKDVTQQRLYLETMEQILRDANKVVLDKDAGGGQGVVPYLPLPEVAKRNAANGGTSR